jgi:hypothetical protein
MKNGVVESVAEVDWQAVSDQMNERGYATVSGFLSAIQCENLTSLYGQPTGYRKTVVMERYRYGLGEYKYFDYPLPGIVQALREALYPRLVPIANGWMEQLGIEKTFPNTLQALQAECHANNQLKPTPLLLKYGKGGFNTLHQDLYGAVYFPLQAAVILNQSGVDFTGGEFVLTQQAVRAQGRAMVLNPDLGDLIIFTTNNRPVRGARGFHRANMKHGVSEVHSGTRHTLGVIFHDAES